MFCRLSQAFANFYKREDGPTTAEYAVMLALLVVGCVVALIFAGHRRHVHDQPQGGEKQSFRDQR